MRHIHFVGIKGVGMTPLAILAKEAGFVVSGSDVEETFITDEALEKAGIKPLVGFSAEHVKGIDLVITTGAHGGFSNPEVVAALERKIPVIPQGKAVGMVMDGSLFSSLNEIASPVSGLAHNDGMYGIAVAGCHGKTTTTAMIATILAQAGLDPSYVIGTSSVEPIGLPGHFGKGKYFIAEADEYMTMPGVDKTPKLHWLKPKIAVITNIEFDHPDVYKDMDAVCEAYKTFITQMDANSVLVVNGEDEYSKKILEVYKGRILRFGFKGEEEYDYTISIESHGMFTLHYGQIIEQFRLDVAGKHNVMNAAAAVIVAKGCGASFADIRTGLEKFSGTKRRMEFIGATNKGALVYDDYAHHPTEIRTSLEGLKEKYPEKKIVCIFQPHTYSRTKQLFEEFSSSFSDADIIILPDIFPSAREAIDTTVSSRQLAESIRNHGKEVFHIASLQDVIQYLNEQKYDESYVIVTMGAGDVYTIGKEILSTKHEARNSK